MPEWCWWFFVNERRRNRYRLRLALGADYDRAVVRWFAQDFMPAVLPSLNRCPVPVAVELVRPDDDGDAGDVGGGA
jgi:hypothetical protein